MSAFIVGIETIDAICTYAHRNGFSYWTGVERQSLNSSEETQKVGQILLSANYNSVNYRYRENTQAPEYSYQEMLSRARRRKIY